MLSKADNELLTNTNPGTPMGELFRRFWLPVALGAELPASDCAPIRVRVLGEDLVAFRDTSGRVGLLQAHCAHRGGPLFFGRNERGGLRCLYHGWKYDVEGNCIDLPNAPEGASLKHKIRIAAYPCSEAGGCIWAYLGPAEKRPPFPEFEWTGLPENHRYVGKFSVGCNYLQSMEADYDPTHFAFLHRNLADTELASQPRPMDANNGVAGDWALDPASWGTLQDSESGVLCVAARELPDGRFSAGVGAPWMMPVFCTGAIAGTELHSSNIRVPIDNENLTFYKLRWSYEPLPEEERNEYRAGGLYYPELIPGTFTPRANRGNDYNVDRLAQQHRSFSGIKGYPLQDMAMAENEWGAIADRTQEHLTSADRHVIHIRQRLIRAARAMAAGVEPSEPWHPEAYRYHYESAVAPSRDEAIALATAHATASRPDSPTNGG